MESLLASVEELTCLCAQTDVADSLAAITDKLAYLAPGFDFDRVLTRGHWHRLGGVVDANHQRVSENISRWAEKESGGDVDELIARHMDSGYFATQLAGKTHYLTAPCGDRAEDFVQLEIEELQEVIDRRLIEWDWFPDSLEEFLDPLDYPRLVSEPIGRPFYRFRRITPIADLISGAQRWNPRLSNLQRFVQDWQKSSASEAEPFCRHWVLALMEYRDSQGEKNLSAKPVSTFSGEQSDLLSDKSVHGAELANTIHAYDRRLGYSFAWFFMMLSCSSDNFNFAEVVLRDQMGAYDYLPAKDLDVLRRWGERPYAV